MVLPVIMLCANILISTCLFTLFILSIPNVTCYHYHSQVPLPCIPTISLEPFLPSWAIWAVFVSFCIMQSRMIAYVHSAACDNTLLTSWSCLCHDWTCLFQFPMLCLQFIYICKITNSMAACLVKFVHCAGSTLNCMIWQLIAPTQPLSIALAAPHATHEWLYMWFKKTEKEVLRLVRERYMSMRRWR